MTRHAGILLHPTSLAGPYGIGDLGPSAHEWVDFLGAAGCRLWQILPLGPTGYGDSPYQSFSAFAGNPYLVSPEALQADGLIDAIEHPEFDDESVDFGSVIPFKLDLLANAYEKFASGRASHPLAGRFRGFKRRQAWLEDYAQFMALKEVHDGKAWVEWPDEYRHRQPEAIGEAKRDLADTIDRIKFGQFLFFRQWEALRARARDQGVRIIGDIPIFVAHDSADVWVKRELFAMKRDGYPRVQAGVPPDYFAPQGQLWGNPLYRWAVHRHNGYQWWVDRLTSTLKLVDLVRFDHFRGFYDYWEVPAGAATAETGVWRRGPGGGLLGALRESIGDLPLIAEDLGGELSPGVTRLRDRFKLPGMKVLQFAFQPGSDHLPHKYGHENWAVYTGTHDNDTTRAWFDNAMAAEQDHALRYMHVDPAGVPAGLIRLAWSSIARYALAPLQDFLELGTEARMNTPNVVGGNWRWRMAPGSANEGLRARLRDLNETYGRLG
jgi:4-alpha-glucanotransferase